MAWQRITKADTVELINQEFSCMIHKTKVYFCMFAKNTIRCFFLSKLRSLRVIHHISIRKLNNNVVIHFNLGLYSD